MDEATVEWVLDPDAAARYSRQHPRRVAEGCEHRMACRCEPSDWVRCEYVTTDLLETVRCAGAYGHFGDHVMPRSK